MKKYKHQMIAEKIRNSEQRPFYLIKIDYKCFVSINEECQTWDQLIELLNKTLGKGKYTITMKEEN